MCQARFMDDNKCTILVGDVDNGVGCACMGARGTREIPVLSSPFCCQIGTAQKKIFFKQWAKDLNRFFSKGDL